MVEREMGFGAALRSQATSLGKPLSIQEIHSIVDSEANQVRSFENVIRQELHLIENVEHNLAVIQSQVQSMDKLIAARNQLVKSIYEECYKPDSQINTSLVMEQFQSLSKIDALLFPQTQTIMKEIRRLCIDDKHTLFSQSQAAQESLKKVDEVARQIFIATTQATENLNSSRETLAHLNEKVQKIQYDRKNPLPSKKTIQGFGQ